MVDCRLLKNIQRLMARCIKTSHKRWVHVHVDTHIAKTKSKNLTVRVNFWCGFSLLNSQTFRELHLNVMCAVFQTAHV